jgi:DNA-binding CsgD family transcriptional regulator
LTVTRLPAMNASWISGGTPRWMLLSFDPDRELFASTELIARDLGLSLREAELAALLVKECDVTLVAQRLHISIHTARTHLKSIFSKTGIRSQTELVRRIASGPAGITACYKARPAGFALPSTQHRHSNGQRP